MHYVLLSVAIVAEVIGTMALRATNGFTEIIPSVTVAVAYATAFYFLSLTLDKISVAIAYSIWSGVGIILIALAGMFIYKQVPDLAAILGMLCIIIGIVAITGFSNMRVH